MTFKVHRPCGLPVKLKIGLKLARWLPDTQCLASPWYPVNGNGKVCTVERDLKGQRYCLLEISYEIAVRAAVRQRPSRFKATMRAHQGQMSHRKMVGGCSSDKRQAPPVRNALPAGANKLAVPETREVPLRKAPRKIVRWLHLAGYQ